MPSRGRGLGAAHQIGILLEIRQRPSHKPSKLYRLPVDLRGRILTDLASLSQQSASVFSYLQMTYIRTAWMTTSNGIEAVCDAFDRNFWGSADAQNAPGTAMAGPSAPNGVTSWGLRTAWCFWIDNHLAKIESKIGPWLDVGKGKLQKHTGGSSQLASKFIASYMGPNGLASARQMRFPRAANFAQTPLPGTRGSATTTNSRYGMWGNNGLGELGV